MNTLISDSINTVYIQDRLCVTTQQNYATDVNMLQIGNMILWKPTCHHRFAALVDHTACRLYLMDSHSL